MKPAVSPQGVFLGMVPEVRQQQQQAVPHRVIPAQPANRPAYFYAASMAQQTLSPAKTKAAAKRTNVKQKLKSKLDRNKNLAPKPVSKQAPQIFDGDSLFDQLGI